MELVISRSAKASQGNGYSHWTADSTARLNGIKRSLAEGALTDHSFSGSFYVKIAILARRPLESAGKFELYVA